jgi:hypothetical protein
MAITSYSGLLTELLRLIDGEDITGSEVPAATLSQIVHLGELRIYREARTRFNEKDWPGTAAVASNKVSLPADFIAASVTHFGKNPLEPIAENDLLERIANNPGGGGDCRFYCNAGPSFSFFPAVADATILQGRYYYKLPDLSVATLPTNALFAAAEDLFIYGALSKSAPFFGQDARIPMWESEYMRILDSMNITDHRTAYSSGRIRRGNSSRIAA